MAIDLRSDTVTKPTPEMLEAMLSAEVGDDVFGEDPTVIALEEKVAEMFGKEAALFCPSGTMTNQIAVKVNTQPQDEMICDQTSHIYRYEGGGAMFNSQVSVRLINGDMGRFTSADVLENINPDDIHFPRTSLVTIENTVNKGGGCVFPLDSIKEITKVAVENKLRMHMDGARIFNAISVSGDHPTEFGKCFHTISVCFSKGLGAPVGSALIGSKEAIHRGRRVRKVLGGGMRQAGFLAAACIYALDHHIDRLAKDHQRAREMATFFESKPYVENIISAGTNIVILSLANDIDVSTTLAKWKEKGLLAVQFGSHDIRMVTHLDFNDDQLEEVFKIVD